MVVAPPTFRRKASEGTVALSTSTIGAQQLHCKTIALRHCIHSLPGETDFCVIAPFLLAPLLSHFHASVSFTAAARINAPLDSSKMDAPIDPGEMAAPPDSGEMKDAPPDSGNLNVCTETTEMDTAVPLDTGEMDGPPDFGETNAPADSSNVEAPAEAAKVEPLVEAGDNAKYLHDELQGRIQSEPALFDWIQSAALDGIWYENVVSAWRSSLLLCWICTLYVPSGVLNKRNSHV